MPKTEKAVVKRFFKAVLAAELSTYFCVSYFSFVCYEVYLFTLLQFSPIRKDIKKNSSPYFLLSSRQTLPDDCPTYFDHDTRLLEAPMVIRVADQVSLSSPISLLVPRLLFPFSRLIIIELSCYLIKTAS